MKSFLDLFYFMMFGGALVAPVLLGLVWLAIKLLKIAPGPLTRRLYQGAVIVTLLLAVIVYELMKPR